MLKALSNEEGGTFNGSTTHFWLPSRNVRNTFRDKLLVIGQFNKKKIERKRERDREKEKKRERARERERESI
jgi:hypothetical protein